MRSNIEEFVDLFLEEGSLEDLLEVFDVTPQEAFEVLFNQGLIDEDLLSEMSREAGIPDGEE